jgi:hypothetical protein
MLQVFIILCVVIVLTAITEIYDDHQQEIDKIKGSVEHDYKQLIIYCKRDQNVLNWVTTLNRRIEAFMKLDEYQVRKPYDKFKLAIPSKRYCGLFAFIVIDKNLNPKFVVNFEPSQHDGGRSEKYLKYCLGYGKEIDNFVKKCESTVMNENLEKKRIKTIENTINK